jgi:two-component system response regulator AtoC
MDTLLLIDDDPMLLESLRLHFEEQSQGLRYRVLTAETGAAGLALVERERPSLVLLDLKLPDRPGIDLIADIRAVTSDTPVVVITGHHDTATTILAMKAGAFDYLHKPFDDPDALTLVVDRALEMGRLSRRVALAVDADQPPRLDDMIAESPAMQRVAKEIGKLATSQATVLLQGESGTGKELAARIIHTYSSDEPRPFVAINCSAIVETLLESELFGHERGAFTGAIAPRTGKCEQASDGTLFLDEIGDMSLGLQAKLLRVLQEREFERVGGNKRIALRARVIAATNRELVTEVAQGRFRDDLYQRLKVMTLVLPPLRQRVEDIPALVTHLLQRINEKVHRHVTRVPKDVLLRLTSLPWTGNVRELENVLTRAVVLSPSDVLLLDDLPQLETSPRGGRGAAVPNATLGEEGPLLTLDEMERRHIARAILAHHGHKGRICESLGISRPTLERKIRKYGLHPEQRTVLQGEEGPETSVG